jgi:hypothetical protein
MGEAGAFELVVLLVRVALGDHDEAVALLEFVERFLDAGEDFDLLLGDGVGEGDDAGVLFGGDRLVTELLETVD